MRAVFAAVLFAAFVTGHIGAQTPTPMVVVPAANAATTTTTTTTVAVPAAADTLQSALKSLQEMKAANEDILRRQQATLQQLDELEKAVEQIRIFSKRG